MGTLFAANTSIMPIGTLIFTYVFQNMSSGGIIFIFSGVIYIHIYFTATSQNSSFTLVFFALPFTELNSVRKNSNK